MSESPSSPWLSPQAGSTVAPAVISEPLLALIAQRMRIVGEPSRIRILLLLERQPANVQEVADELSLAHQSASQHLNVLYRAGVLARAREGSCVRYSIVDYTALRMIQQARASMTGYIEELAHLAEEAA